MTMMQISDESLTETLNYAIKEAIRGERERILKVLNEDALISFFIDAKVLSYLVEVLGL
jgi:hypothetical protein